MLDFGNHAVFHYDDFKVIAVELHENQQIQRIGGDFKNEKRMVKNN